ncbi:MAG: GNAT family N-acetyltransferase [Planctomycetota bacterium]|jgi:RimJ/RimL family protein N-acetyltransferase
MDPSAYIRTKRLLLRCWSPDDAPRVRESIDASDAHLRPWIPFMKNEPRSLEQTADWLRVRREWFERDEHYCYGIFAPEDGALLGEAMLLRRVGPDALEIGYWIDVRRTGKGYATEAVHALVGVAFETHGVARVEIHCSPENTPSVRLARRLGFLESDAAIDLMVWTLDSGGGSDLAR